MTSCGVFPSGIFPIKLLSIWFRHKGYYCTLSFRVPLKHIFGFCEDYDKIVYGLKHTLTLVRKSDDDAIFRANAVDAGKVTIDKISWFMPHVLPADADKFSIYHRQRSSAALL